MPKIPELRKGGKAILGKLEDPIQRDHNCFPIGGGEFQRYACKNSFDAFFGRERIGDPVKIFGHSGLFQSSCLY